MSRSYRRPYSAITGRGSARHDKQTAARGVRRKQNLVLRTTEDFESILLPHRLECHHNNTYTWGRDGGQFLQVPDARQREEFAQLEQGLITNEFEKRWVTRRRDYYLGLYRK